MKILVISRSAWKQSNSFGNTYNNLFSQMKDISIANIYLADGIPDADNPNVTSYYKVSEKEMTSTVLKRKSAENKVGERITEFDNAVEDESNIGSYVNLIQAVKKKRWSLFFLAREFVWKTGNINWSGIAEFAQEFDPDIIFLPFYYAIYVNRVALFLKKKLDIPIVLEASIDIYSLKQLSFDPFYWISRFLIRRSVRATVRKSEKLYVISDQMKKDYERYLHIECGTIYKFPDSLRKLYDYKRERDKLRFLYTGNIGSGRWKTLALIGNALAKNGIGELEIYTPTPLTAKLRKSLCNCILNSPVSPSEIIVLQNNADVLVHVESFGLKDKLEVRYSISTKIMDYISAERCILAVGPSDIASISFLRDNRLALVASSKKMLNDCILGLSENKGLCDECAQNAHEYIAKMALLKSQRETLKSELESIINNYRGKHYA